MSASADDAVAVGIAAWARLRDHERATWADWLDVARALAIGRTVALKAAATNKCVGSKYNAAMGTWLRASGLDGVVAQERYRLLLILQNIEAIEAWRASLDDASRRRLNHPNAIWSHWPAPAVQVIVTHEDGWTIYFVDDGKRTPAAQVFMAARDFWDQFIRQNGIGKAIDDRRRLGDVSAR